MRLTLLGTGEAMGVPPVSVDLDTCDAAARRRRPGLLVETDDATVLFDLGPDVAEQLRATDTRRADAAFLTHDHRDHAGGLAEVGPVAAVLGLTLHATETCQAHVRERLPYPELSFESLGHGETVAVGDLRVRPFPVDHARPDHDTVGFEITHEGTKSVYAPDVGRFRPDLPAGEAYRGADLLFVEGSGFFRRDLPPGDIAFERMIERARAERVVLVHVSEYLSGLSTAEMRARAERAGYELGADFETRSC